MANLNLHKKDVVHLVELDNGVVQITMQDEENCNTFSPGIIDGLYKCFGAVAQNKSYKVVILTGYGSYFCSGGTKKELLNIFQGKIQFNELNFFRLALDCEIPVIAAMQGHGIGGGFVFGLYADLVVLSQESIYTTNFMKYGFTPGLGCTLIVPEKLGVLAHEMMYTAQNYRGQELAQRGVSFPIIPRKDVLKVAKKIAYEMSEKPRISLVTLKENLRAKISDKLPEFIDKELAMHKITFHQPEVGSRIDKLFDKMTIGSSRPQNLSQEFVREERRTDSLNCQPFQLKIPSYGSLDNLTFAPIKRQVPGANEVEVQIKAVPVNFRDVLNVFGMLQEYNEKRLGIASAENMTFGFEGVGTVIAVGANVSKWQVGDEVIVIGLHNAFSSFVICSPNNLLAKPDSLNMVETATIPITFLTAYHGLHNLAKLNSGERVLIHAASGGTGQAAVQLAQFWRAEVFATTSPHKMDFLRKQSIKCVMNSRTTEFADEIMEITKGRGVDVIFNSLTHGEYIPKNIDILASGGRYVEIGKVNIWTHDRVYKKRSDVKYFPFDLGEEFAKNNQLYSQIWDNLGQYFEQNHLHPLPYKEFPIEDVIKAFYYLRRSKHFGRVVVVMPHSYYGQELNAYQLSNQDQMSNQEKILLKLQSGQVSLENAEQLLLEKIEKEIQEKAIEQNQIDDIQSQRIDMDSSEEILSLISAGEISLETAEKILLEEVVEPEIKTEINGLNPSQNDLVSTDIAIIGISCRYPGANNWKDFWHNLKNGIDSVTQVPPGRWEEKNWYHPDPEHPGTSYSKCAGFLDRVDKFDPLFFQISPEEARFMDPQQRIFLEEAYHAIEDAGYATDSLRGRQYGVFVGASTGDYSKLLSISGLNTHRMAMTGNILSVIPARIAYLLDLRGPVVAIDTACSSSLVALHQACESIKQGESEMALVGGINILSTADLQILTSQFQMVSPDGRCKTFDAEASGTVWSEGCGVILLKRYSQAIQDNDQIYGVIKATGVNYDGNTNGISSPSSQSQASLEEAVYQKFGINPETISYVEAHGTATPLGDPIEVEALTEAFSKWTNKKQFCAIGSVKTNIGHSAAAAGVSGLIKTILCLKKHKLVPSLHFNQPNPHIDFENSPFYVNTEFKDWEVFEGQPRQAAVSSFGFSGTNAHVVIEEATSQIKSQKSKNKNRDNLERSLHLLTVSAKTETALSELIVRYKNYLGEENNDGELGDICYTANTGRTHFNHRLAVIASNQQELEEKLLRYKAGEEVVGICSGKLPNDSAKPKIAFLFTGQDSQYVNMGRQLYEESSVFREAIHKCDEILGTFHTTSLKEILYPVNQDQSKLSILSQTTYTQPVIFAIEYALAQLWQSWGIKPDVVMGHSVGEYVAATIAEIFSLEDGLKLIAERGRLMHQLPSGGEMVSVMASESLVKEAIGDCSLVTIAAINGPESIVISGKSEAIATICSKLNSQEIKTKQLQVSHAFHSPLMDSMLVKFAPVAQAVNYSQPKMPIISNVSGQKVGAEMTKAEYWVEHVRQPVRFADSMKTLYDRGYELFLEIGPKPVLLGMGRQCLPEGVGVWLSSLCPGVEDWQEILSSLGKLYVHGAKIDWSEFDKDYTRQKVALPTYPFQRESYWVETKNNVPIYSDVSLQQLFYGIEWQLRVDNQQQKKQQLPRNWIIFSDRDGIGQRLKNILEKRGDRCFMVWMGETYKEKETGSWELNPCNLDDFDNFYQEITITTQDLSLGIIHLWSLETGPTRQLTQSALESAQKCGCGSVLHLLQAVEKHGNLNSTSHQLWLITRGAQSVLPQIEEVAVAQTPLWGLGRVVFQEYPQLWGGLVDLDRESSANEAEMLLQLLENPQGEEQLAVRNGQTYVARLKKKLLAESQPFYVSETGTYLITGGTGALGLSVAEWLVAEGSRYLILISRRQPSEAAQVRINSLQQQGSQVVVTQADVSIEEDIERVLNQVKEGMPPLKGVIHAAGVAESKPLQEMELSQLEAILRPKLLGGWLLHQLTKKLELDYFVNFSSIASVWGSKNQAHYAAANHFLDGLTYYRQSLGLPSSSINWGPWARGGMGTEEALDWLNKRGVQPLQPEKGIAALEKVLASNNPQTVVADINWDLFKQIYEVGGKKLFLEEITVDSAIGDTNKTKDYHFLEKIKSTSQKEREEMLTSHIQKEAARLLGMKVHQIDVNTSLTKMGLDSLMSIELRNQIQTELEVDIAISKFMAGVSVLALSNEINQKIAESDRTDNVKENNWIEVEL